MKEAMWGVGIIVLGLFGLILISLFGNITTTNQQDYEFMKNTTQAAMLDAVDYSAYSKGFCVCSKTKEIKEGVTIKFTAENEYDINKINDGGTCDMTGYKSCSLLLNEYKIDKDVFAESIIRRLATVLKENTDYKVEIKDIIEYPPKASIVILSKNKYNELSSGDNEEYTIVNEYDAILESDKDTITIVIPSKVTVKLVDKSGNLLPNGVITFTGGVDVSEKWNTKNTNPNQFTVFAGNYTATEVTVPSGYKGAEPQTIKVENGKDYVITLVNEKRPPDVVTSSCNLYWYKVNWISYNILNIGEVKRYYKSNYGHGYNSPSSAKNACTSKANSLFPLFATNKNNGCAAYEQYKWKYTDEDGKVTYSSGYFTSGGLAVRSCRIVHPKKGTCESRCMN